MVNHICSLQHILKYLFTNLNNGRDAELHCKIFFKKSQNIESDIIYFVEWEILCILGCCFFKVIAKNSCGIGWLIKVAGHLLVKLVEADKHVAEHTCKFANICISAICKDIVSQWILPQAVFVVRWHFKAVLRPEYTLKPYTTHNKCM